MTKHGSLSIPEKIKYSDSKIKYISIQKDAFVLVSAECPRKKKFLTSQMEAWV